MHLTEMSFNEGLCIIVERCALVCLLGVEQHRTRAQTEAKRNAWCFIVILLPHTIVCSTRIGCETKTNHYSLGVETLHCVYVAIRYSVVIVGEARFEEHLQVVAEVIREV